jgi:orotate phosphoribosyltransferase
VDVLELYRETGALLEGHFLLRSGKHSPVFLQTAALLQHPLYAEAIGEALAAHFENERVDFVIGPAIGGVVLSFVVAKALGARALFAEKTPTGGMTIRPGLEIKPGDRFIAVEDVVTTGGSLRRALEAAVRARAVPVGAAAIIDRSGGDASFAVPFVSLARLDAPAYKPAECPLCKAGVSLEEV